MGIEYNFIDSKIYVKSRLPAGRQGFTLMELLIVIAIIGILISVSVVSYISAQKKSRDSRRISDMKAVQNAWEQYYADNNASYPVATPCAISATYLPGGMPTDPKTGAVYTSKCTVATSYCFCASLEGTTNATVDCNGIAAQLPYTGLYCVSSLQ